MRSTRRRGASFASAIVVAVLTFLFAGVGIAQAAGDGSIDLGSNGPTTTVTEGGAPIELIPAASAELPPASSAPASGQIEVQGVSSTTGPTAAAGVDGHGSVKWWVLGAIVVIGAAVLVAARTRRVARH